MHNKCIFTGDPHFPDAAGWGTVTASHCRWRCKRGPFRGREEAWKWDRKERRRNKGKEMTRRKGTCRHRNNEKAAPMQINVRTCSLCSSIALQTADLEGCGSSASGNNISSIGNVCGHGGCAGVVTYVVPTAALKHVQKSSLELLCSTTELNSCKAS